MITKQSAEAPCHTAGVSKRWMLSLPCNLLFGYTLKILKEKTVSYLKSFPKYMDETLISSSIIHCFDISLTNWERKLFMVIIWHPILQREETENKWPSIWKWSYISDINYVRTCMLIKTFQIIDDQPSLVSERHLVTNIRIFLSLKSDQRDRVEHTRSVIGETVQTVAARDVTCTAPPTHKHIGIAQRLLTYLRNFYYFGAFYVMYIKALSNKGLQHSTRNRN